MDVASISYITSIEGIDEFHRLKVEWHEVRAIWDMPEMPHFKVEYGTTFELDGNNIPFFLTARHILEEVESPSALAVAGPSVGPTSLSGICERVFLGPIRKDRHDEEHKFVGRGRNNLSIASCLVGGLLKTYQKPNQATASFTYDDMGRLVHEDMPGGGSWTLTRTGPTLQNVRAPVNVNAVSAEARRGMSSSVGDRPSVITYRRSDLRDPVDKNRVQPLALSMRLRFPSAPRRISRIARPSRGALGKRSPSPRLPRPQITPKREEVPAT